MINRIRELLEVRQLSPTQFADLIGVGRPVISHILSERNKPSLEVVQKVLDAFPDISLSWLMKGIGPMLTNAAPAIPLASADAAPPVQQAPVEAAPTQPVAPLTPPAPTIPLNSSPQPQAFVTYNPNPVATARPAAATQPPPRPLPPKFRPAKAVTSPDAAPAPVPAAAELADVGPITASPINQTRVATFPTTPSPTPQSVLAAAVGYGSIPDNSQATPAPSEAERMVARASATEYQQTATATQPAPVATSQVAAAPLASVATNMPLAVAPPAPVAEVATAPNPAAALSFLGEPGKAIRRIVIFYRDGSFSDYVPEGY